VVKFVIGLTPAQGGAGEPGRRLIISRPGEIAPRSDTNHELYVAVLSNRLHLTADTGRMITCPFVPGRLPDGVMAMVVAVDKPEGALLPELVQWLQVSRSMNRSARSTQPRCERPRRS